MSRHRVSTFSLPFIIIPHYTNSCTYSHPNLNSLEYTIQILVPHVMCPSGAWFENRPHLTPSTSLVWNPKRIVVQWVGIGTYIKNPFNNGHSKVCERIASIRTEYGTVYRSLRPERITVRENSVIDQYLHWLAPAYKSGDPGSRIQFFSFSYINFNVSYGNFLSYSSIPDTVH